MNGPYICKDGCDRTALYKFQEGMGGEPASYCVNCGKSSGQPYDSQIKRAMHKYMIAYYGEKK